MWSAPAHARLSSRPSHLIAGCLAGAIPGLGPCSTDYVNPVYVLNGQGIFTTNTAGQLGQDVTESMSGCFTFKVGDKVRGPTSAGTVVGAQCSPVNQYTQYWVQTPSGDRFWATASELTLR